MNALIVFSEADVAGKNIAKHILSSIAFGFREKKPGIWESEKRKGVLVAKVNELHIYSEMEFPSLPYDYDYIIVASRHKSESGTPSLTCHIPGNWGAADFGGKPKTLNIAFASKLKTLLRETKKSAEAHNIKWTVCLEVDHHGPTIGKPILYAEVGSTEAQWNDDNACAAVADAIIAAVNDERIYECYFGVGGNHYAPAFTGLMLGSETRAVGHILPKYKVDDIDFETFAQAAQKNFEPLAGVLLDWKGLSAPQREKIIGFCEKANLKWEKI